MLQQTNVKTVAPYYARFLARWPTVTDLAAERLEEVLKLWAGLGYYARARNLHACARDRPRKSRRPLPAIPRRNCVTLPGIGAYTAAAIAAIAFDRKATPVDGNIERVIARLFAVEEPLPGAKPKIQRARGDADAGTARRRFRAGDDGSRRHDLHAEAAGLCAVSLERALRCAQARRSGDVSAQDARRPKASCGAARPLSSFAPTAHCSRAPGRTRGCLRK